MSAHTINLNEGAVGPLPAHDLCPGDVVYLAGHRRVVRAVRPYRLCTVLVTESGKQIPGLEDPSPDGVGAVVIAVWVAAQNAAADLLLWLFTAVNRHVDLCAVARWLLGPADEDPL